MGSLQVWSFSRIGRHILFVRQRWSIILSRQVMYSFKEPLNFLSDSFFLRQISNETPCIWYGVDAC